VSLHANLDGSGKSRPHWIQTVERSARGSRYTDYAVPTATKLENNSPDIYVGHPTVL
jgi:hypothetical protein